MSDTFMRIRHNEIDRKGKYYAGGSFFPSITFEGIGLPKQFEVISKKKYYCDSDLIYLS